MSVPTPPKRKSSTKTKVGVVFLIIGLLMIPYTWVLYVSSTWSVRDNGSLAVIICLGIMCTVLLILGLEMIVSGKTGKSKPPDEPGEE